jgi:hypothetical protein
LKEDKMKKAVELCGNDLNRALFDDTMFFSIAEGGAMGEPGAVYFYVKDGTSYHFNYLFGEVPLEKIADCFPVFASCSFGMFGSGSRAPKGWRYVYLGAGNHLIINAAVYQEFLKRIPKNEEPSIVYMKWMQAADEILAGESADV